MRYQIRHSSWRPLRRLVRSCRASSSGNRGARPRRSVLIAPSQPTRELTYQSRPQDSAALGQPVFRCWACSARLPSEPAGSRSPVCLPPSSDGAGIGSGGYGRRGGLTHSRPTASRTRPRQAKPGRQRHPPRDPSCSSPAGGESAREAGPVRPGGASTSRSTCAARGFGTLGCTAILLKGVRSRVGVQTFPPFSAGLVEAFLSWASSGPGRTSTGALSLTVRCPFELRIGLSTPSPAMRNSS